LVGHDFFLFVNEETGRPSVVYRRHAYDYGLRGTGDVGTCPAGTGGSARTPPGTSRSHHGRRRTLRVT
ncbi:sigma 54 modulation/S30EA ribosomal C-terminal domain-containing protein, partial [Corynebacterium bovis]